MILVDTDGLLRGLVRTETHHDEVRNFLENNDEPLIMSPFVLGELNYWLRKRLGQAAAISLLREVEDGAYEFVPVDLADLAEARTVIESQPGLEISLADASLVVLARKLRCDRVLTYDKHFRTLQPGGPGSYFTLLP